VQAPQQPTEVGSDLMARRLVQRGSKRRTGAALELGEDQERPRPAAGAVGEELAGGDQPGHGQVVAVQDLVGLQLRLVAFGAVPAVAEQLDHQAGAGEERGVGPERSGRTELCGLVQTGQVEGGARQGLPEATVAQPAGVVLVGGDPRWAQLRHARGAGFVHQVVTTLD
jgi:hypothetical protein